MRQLSHLPAENCASRRDFVKSMAGIRGVYNVIGTKWGRSGRARWQWRRKYCLGIDNNFAVRGMGWKGEDLIDYAAGLKVDSAFITDLDAFGSLEDSPKELKTKAADKGLKIYAGSVEHLPASPTFKKTWGTAEEHLALAIRVAKGVGSPVIRVILGNGSDRLTPGLRHESKIPSKF